MVCMSARKFDADLVSARWILGLIPGEELPGIAITALESGLDGTALRETAGLFRPTIRDAGTIFKRALEEMGCKPITKLQAGVYWAKEIAGQIVTGEIDPYEGACRIWSDVWQECDRPEQLTPLVALASEYEDDFARRPLYAEDIIREAQKLLAEGDAPQL